MGDVNDDWSDEEFAGMRKVREEIRVEHEQIEKEINQCIKDSLVGHKNVGEGVLDDNNAMSSGSIYEIWSEEESDVDEEYAYAGPSEIRKRRVNQPFNPCIAGKDMKWSCGLIFGSKEEFKNVVREFSIATGRPLRYRVDAKHKIHVTCAEGCPFRMWVSFMSEYEG